MIKLGVRPISPKTENKTKGYFLYTGSTTTLLLPVSLIS